MSITGSGGRLDGKVALITGAARGQGAAEARLFAREGARVIVTDILEEQGRAVAETAGAIFIPLDVRLEASWDAAMGMVQERYGRLDVLVNNAGVLQTCRLLDLDLASYSDSIAVNQTGCFLGMRAAARIMKTGGGGSIINISSLSGFRGGPGALAYTAGKFAVRGMTKVAAIELGPLGIRVNSIHPGGVRTPMVTAEADKQGIDIDSYFRTLPLGRIGEPEDIARLALFLASDDSAYCTGAEFIADGGELAGRPPDGN